MLKRMIRCTRAPSLRIVSDLIEPDVAEQRLGGSRRNRSDAAAIVMVVAICSHRMQRHGARGWQGDMERHSSFIPKASALSSADATHEELRI